jgi:hypothetical protein
VPSGVRVVFEVGGDLLSPGEVTHARTPQICRQDSTGNTGCSKNNCLFEPSMQASTFILFNTSLFYSIQ